MFSDALHWDCSAYDKYKYSRQKDLPWVCPGCNMTIEPNPKLKSSIRKRANAHKRVTCQWFVIVLVSSFKRDSFVEYYIIFCKY